MATLTPSGWTVLAQSSAGIRIRARETGIMSCGVSSFSGCQIRQPRESFRICTLGPDEEGGLEDVIGLTSAAAIHNRMRRLHIPPAEVSGEAARLAGHVEDLVSAARALPTVEHVLLRCHETRGFWCVGDSRGHWREAEYHDNLVDLTLVLTGGVIVPIRWGSGIEPVSTRQLTGRLQRISAILSLPVRPLEYRAGPILLEPEAAALLIHEVYGHALESDAAVPCLATGHRVGPAELSICDDPTIPGLRASYRFDCDGQAAVRTALISRGAVVGMLHSLDTANAHGCASTGNSRSPSFRFRPSARMSVLDIQPSDCCIQGLRNGASIALIDAIDAQTDGDMFCLRSSLAVLLQRGSPVARVHGVVLSGPCTRVAVDALSRERSVIDSLQCVGAASEPLPVTCISPGLLISGVDLEEDVHA